MKYAQVLTHEFVEHLPDQLKDGVIYISISYATAAHKCCCGCGNEIITPLSPTDWRLIFDGKTISLNPSIGNWSLACHSHYWITNNRVRWAPKWSQKQIDRGRSRDGLAKERYFDRMKSQPSNDTSESSGEVNQGKQDQRLRGKMKG
jgi:hypothetical protein